MRPRARCSAAYICGRSTPSQRAVHLAGVAGPLIHRTYQDAVDVRGPSVRGRERSVRYRAPMQS